ncbi:MAG: RNA pseudouridine synthase [Saprospiraceae bacterium]|nr:RNA pseudouridine synthase [Saprospiraceae bacterium]
MEYSIDDLIIYQDDRLITVNKPTGVLVQGDPSGSWNLTQAMEQRFSRQVYLINRIDRPVSGAVIFALSKSAYNELMKKWKEEKTVKTYIAIAEGTWSEERRIIENRLVKGRNQKAIIRSDGKLSKMAVSSYPIYERYTLCIIQLNTGRFHQIRALMSHEGHSIKGDVKYGARRKNEDRSIHLHCYQISIPGIIEIKCALPQKDILWKKAEEFLLKNDL